MISTVPLSNVPRVPKNPKVWESIKKKVLFASIKSLPFISAPDCPDPVPQQTMAAQCFLSSRQTVTAECQPGFRRSEVPSRQNSHVIPKLLLSIYKMDLYKYFTPHHLTALAIYSFYVGSLPKWPWVNIHGCKTQCTQIYIFFLKQCSVWVLR